MQKLIERLMLVKAPSLFFCVGFLFVLVSVVCRVLRRTHVLVRARLCVFIFFVCIFAQDMCRKREQIAAMPSGCHQLETVSILLDRDDGAVHRHTNTL